MGTNKPLTYRGREVDVLLGISKSTRYAMQDPASPQWDSSWPLPIKLSARSTGYLVSEIEAWLASRPRVRDINPHQLPQTHERQLATSSGRDAVKEERHPADTCWVSHPGTSGVKQMAEE